MLKGLQLERHRKYITGSKVASILGLEDAYQSKFSLFSQMKEITPWPELDSERLRAGNHMEKCLHSWCEAEYGWRLMDGPGGGKFHREYDFLYGLVDRLMIDDGGDPIAVVEFKNVDGFMSKYWEDGPPDKFRAQVIFYQMLYNLQSAWIVACFGGAHFEKYEIPRNRELENFILLGCLQFWDDLKNDRWPEPDGSEDCTKTLGSLFGDHSDELIEGSDENFHVARKYVELKNKISELEADKDLCGNKLRDAIGGSLGMKFPDGSKATWKMTKPKKEKFDEKKFSKNHQYLYEQYLSLPPGYRRLNVNIKEVKTY